MLTLSETNKIECCWSCQGKQLSKPRSPWAYVLVHVRQGLRSGRVLLEKQCSECHAASSAPNCRERHLLRLHDLSDAKRPWLLLSRAPRMVQVRSLSKETRLLARGGRSALTLPVFPHDMSTRASSGFILMYLASYHGQETGRTAPTARK